MNKMQKSTNIVSVDYVSISMYSDTCIHVVKIHCWLSGSPLFQEKRRLVWVFHQYLKYHISVPSVS